VTKREDKPFKKEKTLKAELNKSVSIQDKEDTAKEENQVQTQKNLSTKQIAIIIIVLVAGVATILYTNEVFDNQVKIEDSVQTDHVQQHQNNNNINLQEVQELNNLEAAVLADSTNLSKLLELGHKLNDSGFYEKAIKYYQIYLRSNSSDVDVIVDMGVCFFQLHDFPVAKSVMKRALKIKPEHQIANFNLGVISNASGNTDSAKVMWKKAFELDPNSDIGKQSKHLLDIN